MVVLHCTQKLLKELGKPPLCNLVNSSSNDLESWYANLLRFHRKKCILFTNEKTLYSFLVPNILRADLKEIQTLFFTNLRSNLDYEGFPPDVINQVISKHQDLCFAKTSNRSVIGSMLDFDFQYYFDIATMNDFNNILDINYKINRMPMSYIKYMYPIEALSHTLVSNNNEAQFK